MRLSRKCPKCNGKRLAVLQKFCQPDHESPSFAWPLAAATVMTGMLMTPTVNGLLVGNRETLGYFETWICLSCGFTEFCARGLEGIEQLARQCPDQVRIFDEPDPPGGS